MGTIRHFTTGMTKNIGLMALLMLGLASHGLAQGTLMPLPAQFFDNNGDPLNAGTVTFYACGTTTNQSAYSNRALSSALANPATLDSAGRLTIFFDDLCYRVILKNSAGTTIWDIDNIDQSFPWSGTTFTGTVKNLAPTTLTVTSNAVVPTRTVHALDTAGGAVNLNTITATNFTTGAVLHFYGNNPGANPVTVKDGVGNIDLAGGDYTLNDANRWITLVFQGTTWYELARSATATVVNNRLCEGRITLTTAVPITTADVTAATTVYFTPYQGNVCALYDGSTWNLRTFAELSLALGADAANTNYDLWMFDNAGTATLERLAWTNDTTRATAVALQDGVNVKSGTTTRRYLGTYRTTGSAGQTEDSYAKRFVYNHYHRIPRSMRVIEATNTWAYTLATWRQANGAAANQLAFVVGLAEVELSVDVRATVENSAAGTDLAVGIGIDSTSALAANQILHNIESNVVDLRAAVSAHLLTYPAIGYHTAVWLEYSEAAGTTTWTGDDGGTIRQSGITGTLR